MAESVNLNALIEEAKASGFNNDPMPDGAFEVEVVNTNHKVAQSGNFQIGVRFKVLSGPEKNRTFWQNLTLSPNNGGIFMRQVQDLAGKDEVASAVAQGAEPSHLPALIQGAVGTATISHKRLKNDGTAWEEVKFKRVGLVQAGVPQVQAPVATATPAVAPVAPVPQAGAPATAFPPPPPASNEVPF